ncbi:MAG TPA: Ku protein [Thermoanaerobaculia bacterium]|nr:Ku protein [Thermoanaerobaculia bacterium]
MPRSIWKGSISFGLVNIPVGLYSAESREEISFHLLDKRNMARVRYKRVNEQTGKEVPWEETVRGYEFESGQYVIMTDEDLKRANPESTQTVDIVDFVDLDDISPTYFDKPYYLAPDKKGRRSYALLRETLKRTRKVGIAKVVIRTKQYLAAVMAQDDVILLEILRFAHELRDPGELDLPSGNEGVSERELDMAERLVEGMVDSWKPERYKDDYQKDLMALIKERVKAGQLESPPASDEEEKELRPARGQVVDLMALLKQSVDQRGKGGHAADKDEKPKKAAAKKAPAKAARKPAARRTATKSTSGSRKKKSA